MIFIQFKYMVAFATISIYATNDFFDFDALTFRVEFIGVNVYKSI